MSTVEKLPDLGGLLSEGCQKCNRKPCYEECSHLNDVMLAYYNFENYQPSERHRALTESLLNMQDGQLSEICGFEFDDCVIGEWSGFPCIQCKDVCDSGTIAFECGYDKLEFTNCVTTKIDFQSTPALSTIYSSVVTALGLSYDATVKGVEEYANNVFGVVSQVINFTNDTMYLDITRALTADELTAWGFIKDTFPVPIGAEVNLVTI